MITREEAWITATSSEDERETEWARTVVALYDERDQHLNAEVVAGKMGVDGTDVLYVTIRVPLSRNRDFPMGATVRVLTQPKGAP